MWPSLRCRYPFLPSPPTALPADRAPSQAMKFCVALSILLLAHGEILLPPPAPPLRHARRRGLASP